MWLLPLFSWVARTAARLFYRLDIEGTVPPRGPVLLVANHPNSLLDPALVVAAARRPVRFLAKAPLFEDPRVGWLVRAVGSIPVVRRLDDPAAGPESNVAMFRAAHRALAEGAAIGLFPEGISHSEPQLQPLKTGAARIALGALDAPDLQIIPVGLVFRGLQKGVFRSQALVLLGEPLAWDDLRPSGSEESSKDGNAAGASSTAPSAPSPEVVRELTRRIDSALRRVSINAERWEDLPLLECAEAIWRCGRKSSEQGDEVVTEQRSSKAEARRIERLQVATQLLARERRQRREALDRTSGPTPSARGSSTPAPPLSERVALHCTRLEGLGLEPAHLYSEVSWSRALGWTLTRLHLLGVPALLLAAVGYLVFWTPFRLTGWLVKRLRVPADQVSTNKLLFGAVIYGVWLLLLALLAGFLVGRFHVVAGISAAVLLLVLLIACGVLGLLVRERWRTSTADVRRFLALTTKRHLVATLATEQDRLAAQIDALVRSHQTEDTELGVQSDLFEAPPKT